MHKFTYTAIIIRLILSFSVFIDPLFGIFLSSVIGELIDYPLIYLSGESFKKYQIIDKYLDLFYYLLLFLSISLYDFTYESQKYLLVFFFFLRLIAQLIFFKTKKQFIFVLFPNFFEYYFASIMIFERFFSSKNFPQSLTFWVVFIALKVMQEFVIHIIADRYLKIFTNPIDWLKRNTMKL